MQLPEFAKFYQQLCRFDEFLGLDLTVLSPGEIRYRLTVGEQHLSMPNYCHGGVLAAMMDAVLGLTALSKVYAAGKLCQTVEFKINYLSTPIVGDDLLGSGTIEFSGSTIVVTSAVIVNAAEHRPLAKGMGTFSLYPLTKRAAELGLSGLVTPAP